MRQHDTSKYGHVLGLSWQALVSFGQEAYLSTWVCQVGRVMMRLWASFLNNSSSRWEPIWENWPLQLDMVDNVSPIYRSDFCRCCAISYCSLFYAFSLAGFGVSNRTCSTSEVLASMYPKPGGSAGNSAAHKYWQDLKVMRSATTGGCGWAPRST